MHELIRLLIVIALAGVGVTLLGSIAAWFGEDTRRIRRGLRRVLKGEPEALLAAPGRGRGVGFRFSTGELAVTWDTGAWCLIYGIEELMGAEMLIDGQVVARTFRHEPRRALEQVVTQASQVTLRLVFDDPSYPDFDLELWAEGDETTRNALTPSQAVQEANRWIARAESILRRSTPRRPIAVANPTPNDHDLWDEAAGHIQDRVA